ncbi:MAG TPA: response regulator [Rhodothermales bacterium]|nr:response regulator [Rhodothermales bacterium]
MKKIYLFVILHIIFFHGSLMAQTQGMYVKNFQKRVWSTVHGLPVNHANELDEDDEGFIWICTVEGLVRFDGMIFKVFSKENVSIFKSNSFQKVEPLGKDVWFLSSDQYLYRYHGGVFTQGDLPFKRVDQIWGDRANNLLYLIENGNFHIVKNRKIIFTEKNLNPLLGRITKEGILLNTERKLYHYFNNKNKIEEINFEIIKPNVIYSYLYSQEESVTYVMDNTWRMWMYSKGEVSRVSILDGVVFPSSEGQYPFSLTFIKSGMFYKKEKDKLIRRGEEVKSHSPKRAKYSLTSLGRLEFTEQSILLNGQLFDEFNTTISDAIVDKRGMIWVSTAKGLVQYYKKYVHMIGHAEGIINDAIYWIHETEKGEIYAGDLTSIGYQFDREKFIPKTIDGHVLTVVTEDNKGNVWAGSGKICQIHPANLQNRLCVDVPNNMEALNSVFSDKLGNFWVAYPNILYRSNNLSKGWEKVSDVSGKTIWGVYRIQDGRNGEVWFGTKSQGLFRYSKGKIIQFILPEEACGSGIREIIPDTATSLLLGTESNGICHIKLDINGKLVKQVRIGKEEGLFQNGIHRIIDDGHGRYWMNTNYGIFWVFKKDVYDYIAGRTSWVPSLALTEAHGLNNREGNGGKQDAGQKMKDGTIWFPTMKGIAVIDPNKIPDRMLSGVKNYLSEVEHVGETLPLQNNITYPQYVRDIVFKYGALSFEFPENTLFRVKLVGYDENWRPATSLRMVNYTNLDYGYYTLQIQAGIGGKWGNTTSYSFYITSYWYETLWFKLLLFLLTIGIIYAGIKSRVNFLTNRAKYLEKIVHERTIAIQHQQETLQEQHLQLQEQTQKIVEQTNKLKSLDEVKSRLFVNLAHEIRTPLTIMIEPIRLLQKKYSARLTDSDKWMVDIALENGKRILDLVNQLLQIARLEAGVIPLSLKTVSIVSVLKEWLEINYGKIDTITGVEIRTEIPNEEFQVITDIEKVYTILSNLVSNAIKYSPKGSCTIIRFHSEPKEKKIYLSVSDQGTGIDPKLLDQIFTWYYRSPEHADSTGTGIGLSLSKELAKSLDGDLTVQSELGVGSTFTLILPYVQALPDSLPEPKRAKNVLLTQELEKPRDYKPTGKTKPKILLVEDNVEIAQLLIRYLSENYQVSIAINGKEALVKAKESLPDLVITDIMMPEMDGWTFMRQFRKIKDFRAIPVIVITAKADAQAFHDSLDFGADAYITKPFSLETVGLQVQNLLQLKREIAQKTHIKMLIPENTPKMTLPVKDDRETFLYTFDGFVVAHLDEANLDINILAHKMGMSRSLLFRKLKEAANASPKQYINRLRMEHAMKLLKANVPVTQVTFAVGYQSLAGFSKAFKSHFGISPSEV